jgi:hypothetical protein
VRGVNTLAKCTAFTLFFNAYLLFFTMKKSLFFVIFICLSAVLLAQDKQIHVLLILDTDFYSREYAYSSELQNGAENTRIHVRQEALFLMRHFNLTENDVHFYEVSGERKQGKNNFTAEGLQMTLDSMTQQVQPQDIVIVASYSHGMKSERANIAPIVCIGAVHDRDYLYFDDVLKKIEEKHPSFILSLVTACQKDVHTQLQAVAANSPRYPTSYKGVGIAPTMNRKGSTFQYTKLFENEAFNQFRTVSVEFYSCQKDQVAYVDSWGGIFFKEWLDVFDKKISKGGTYDISWEKIAQQVRDNVEDATTHSGHGTQSPIALIRYIKPNGTVIKEYCDKQIFENRYFERA